jgi:hypothetical protein
MLDMASTRANTPVTIVPKQRGDEDAPEVSARWVIHKISSSHLL